MPSDSVQAALDLRRMHQAGVRAVRTELVRSDWLLTLADSLGINFFQDLPFDGLSAHALIASMDTASELASELAVQFEPHPSARHFGLARRSDTSNPAACAFFDAIAARFGRLRESQVYYTTVFIEDDRCADTVDLVLLDVRDDPEPAAALRRWNNNQATVPVGIAAVGARVLPGAYGLLHPYSEESQARYLETHLSALLESRIAPAAVFVYRWRDMAESPTGFGRAAIRPSTYGLQTADGDMRPSGEVLQGLYLQTRDTYVFPQGESPAKVPPWSVILGWLSYIAIAVCYRSSAPIQDIVSRYFLRRGFYQEVLRLGRELSLGPAVVLFCALSLASGVIFSSGLWGILEIPSFRHFFLAQSASVQPSMLALLSSPALVPLAFSGFHAMVFALWATLLSTAWQSDSEPDPKEMLVAVVLPLWPCLVLLAVTMVAAAGEHLMLACYALVAWPFVDLWATVQSLRDYAAITEPRPLLTWIFVLIRPGSLIVISSAIMLLASAETRADALFLWHLITRS